MLSQAAAVFKCLMHDLPDLTTELPWDERTNIYVDKNPIEVYIYNDKLIAEKYGRAK